MAQTHDVSRALLYLGIVYLVVIFIVQFFIRKRQQKITEELKHRQWIKTIGTC